MQIKDIQIMIQAIQTISIVIGDDIPDNFEIGFVDKNSDGSTTMKQYHGVTYDAENNEFIIEIEG